jgi:hypothetical protein
MQCAIRVDLSAAAPGRERNASLTSPVSVSPWRDRAIASEGFDANMEEAHQKAALISHD